MKEYLLTIEEKEKGEILLLNERIAALNELYMGFENLDLEDRDGLISKMRQSANETEKDINLWWDKIKVKYNLKKKENGQWILDFETNDIYLES